MKRKHLKRIAKYIAKRLERDVNWNMNLTLTKRADDPSYAGEWTSDDDGGKIGIESVEVTPRTSGYIAPSESFYTAATLPPKHVPFDKPSKKDNELRAVWSYADSMNTWSPPVIRLHGELVSWLAKRLDIDRLDDYEVKHTFTLRKREGVPHLDLPLTHKVKSDD